MPEGTQADPKTENGQEASTRYGGFDAYGGELLR
jgi:hypothetical protein